MNSRHTALGDPGTPEEQARFKAEQATRRKALDRARVVILDGWTAAYQTGVISLESMCKGVVAAAAVLPDDMAMVGLIGGRDRLIGYAIRTAIEKPPSKKQRITKWPPLFKEMAAHLAHMVREHEGCVLKPARGEPKGGEPAPERVAEIFKAAGIAVTGRIIETWCDEYRKSPNLRDDE